MLRLSMNLLVEMIICLLRQLTILSSYTSGNQFSGKTTATNNNILQGVSLIVTQNEIEEAWSKSVFNSSFWLLNGG